MTKAQREALKRAAENGNAWWRKPGGYSLVWSASRSRCIGRLFEQGLLTREGKITEAGNAALAT